MSVYVDQPIHRLGRMLMCHMLADSIDELHEMATALGLRRSWYQPVSTPHYDVAKGKRSLAIDMGAKEVTRQELVVVIKRIRAEILEDKSTWGF